MTANIVLASESAEFITAAREAANLGRPKYVSGDTLNLIVLAMRAAGREELVHYAGACYRDEVAWRVSVAWLAQPERTESELKAVALNQTYGRDLTSEDVRAANPGMR